MTGSCSPAPGAVPLRRSNFCRPVWHPALRASGLPPIHFHDLRHTGNQFAADEGANLRELMDQPMPRSEAVRDVCA
jgi:integrase